MLKLQGGAFGRIVGWFGLTLICSVSPSCPLAQPVLPISHQPKQNQADGVTAKIKVNPTQLSKKMPLPVQYLSTVNKIALLINAVSLHDVGGLDENQLSLGVPRGVFNS